MKHKRLNRDGWGFSYYPYYQMRIEDEFCENLVAYANGQPLKHVVDRAVGY